MPRFAMIGGFLGAGKTTLLGRLAARYVAAGKKVALVTNDQADGLVDTATLRAQGFDVGEVAGACFCCQFDELVQRTDAFEFTPDIILAEPVGSCTDLVATVVRPMQQLLGSRLDVAPFGVLFKPSHGTRILGGGQRRSGFSPQAEYIFRKQIEEADYLMVGRADTMDAAEREQQQTLLETAAPGVPVLFVSPTEGEGVEDVMGYIESPMTAGIRRLDIDYDTYAEGEAEMGWVNATAVIDVEASIDLNRLATDVINAIGSSAGRQGEIGHIKVSVAGGDTRAVQNIVATDSQIDVALNASHTVAGPITVIVNARVATDPDILRTIVDDALVVRRYPGASIQSKQIRSLSPGRPEPTHRIPSSGASA